MFARFLTCGCDFVQSQTKILKRIHIQAATKRRLTFDLTGHTKIKDLLQTIDVSYVLGQKNARNRLISVSYKATVYEAIKLMSENGVGATVIFDNHGELDGIFTERDYLYRLVLEGRFSKDTNITKVMSKVISLAYPDDDLERCSRVMARQNKRHLPVVSDYGKLVGMISSKDIVHQVARLGEMNPHISELDASVSDVYEYLGRKSSGDCSVHKEDTVLTALQKMKRYKIGAVWVTEGQKIVGIFTERDYLNDMILKGRFSQNTLIKDVMKKNVVVVDPGTCVRECLSVMADNGMHNLPVMPLVGDQIDYDRHVPIGLFTTLDALKFFDRGPTLQVQVESNSVHEKVKQDALM